METIAIIGGTGDQGYGLALRWLIAGRPIVIGSRDQRRAENAAERLSAAVIVRGTAPADVRGMTNAAAAAAARIVVVTVPLVAQVATVKSIRESLQQGSYIIDVTVPLATAIGGRASRMLGLPAGSAAQQLAEYVPAGVQVLSAFHFLSAEMLANPALRMDCDVVGCGGDAVGQEILRSLAEDIDGVRYVHAGPLAVSSLVEATATLLIAMNVRHKSHQAGLRVTGLDVRGALAVEKGA